MASQMVFKRYELKYMLTLEQYDELKKLLAVHALPDAYPHSRILSLYYDTDDYRLIRRSLEGPVYKEKLRVRRYAGDDENATVFVELKKKYEGIVYKRRIAMPYEKAMHYMSRIHAAPDGQMSDTDRQIMSEIDYVKNFYETLQPKMLIAYERDSYYGKDNKNLRITFDSNARYRTQDLTLTRPEDGLPIWEDGKVLMEIKTPGGLPMWMVRFLNDRHIYKTSFSKYGRAYILEYEKRGKETCSQDYLNQPQSPSQNSCSSYAQA